MQHIKPQFIVLSFVLLHQQFPMDSCDVFSHIFQGCFSNTCVSEAILQDTVKMVVIWTQQHITHPDSKVHGPTWGPSGADRTQVGPMLAPWTLLSGQCKPCVYFSICTLHDTMEQKGHHTDRFLYPPPIKLRGCILVSLCPSVCPSVRPSVIEIVSPLCLP